MRELLRLVIAVLAVASATAASAQPFGSRDPMALDSHGTVWLASVEGRLYRVDAGGVISEARFENAAVNTPAIAADRDGNLFVLGSAGAEPAILRITGGALSAAWKNPLANVADFVVGPDGALWLTQQSPNAPIARMAMDGTFTYVDLSAPSGTLHIVAGSDGNLWATAADRQMLYRITPSGIVVHFPIEAAALAASGDRIVFTTSGGHGSIDVNDWSVRTWR